MHRYSPLGYTAFGTRSDRVEASMLLFVNLVMGGLRMSGWWFWRSRYCIGGEHLLAQLYNLSRTFCVVRDNVNTNYMCFHLVPIFSDGSLVS